MSGLSILTIAFGLCIIAIRGPLIFAHARTLEMYRWLLGTTARVRAFGGAMVLLSLGLVVLAWGAAQPEARIIGFIGGFVAVAVCVLLLVLPHLYRRMALAMLDAMQNMLVMRFIGLLGTAFGGVMLYLAITVA